MARRALSISVKMIFTTTLLIVLTVFGFGVLNAQGIRGVYDEAAAERTEQFRDALSTTMMLRFVCSSNARDSSMTSSSWSMCSTATAA
jgi:hypothetical protein